RHVAATIALKACFEDLAVWQLQRVREASDEVIAVVAVRAIRALAVVRAERDDAIVARALQAARDELAEPGTHRFGRPVKERAEVPLVLAAAVDRVVAIERQAVLARLQVLEPERDLRLADSDPELLRRVERDIGVEVAEL